jgi:cytochrome P450
MQTSPAMLHACGLTHQLCSRLTLDIIGPAAIGRDFQSLENENDPVSQNFNAILKPSLDLLMLFAVSIILPQWFVKRIPCNANSVLPEKVEYLRNLFADILHEKRAQIAQEKAQQEAAEGDILGTMMRGGEFSDSELVDQMLTFLAAGVCFVLPKDLYRLSRLCKRQI